MLSSNDTDTLKRFYNIYIQLNFSHNNINNINNKKELITNLQKKPSQVLWAVETTIFIHSYIYLYHQNLRGLILYRRMLSIMLVREIRQRFHGNSY